MQRSPVFLPLKKYIFKNAKKRSVFGVLNCLLYKTFFKGEYALPWRIWTLLNRSADNERRNARKTTTASPLGEIGIN